MEEPKIIKTVDIECSVIHDGHHILHGRPHGALYKDMYTVEVRTFDKEEARKIAAELGEKLNREVDEGFEVSSIYLRRKDYGHKCLKSTLAATEGR